jgi:mannose-6-phosphate isomerase
MIQYSESRPWGIFEILLDSEKTKVKRITVNPNAALSYQYHHKRSEHWVIIEGIATIILDGIEHTVMEGNSIYIPVGAKHRIINKQKHPLIFIEVQIGTYFGEDDIVRIEDIYDRK